MKKLLSYFLILMPIVLMGATVSGYVIDSATNQGVEEIMVIMHRFEPNGWENITFYGSSSSDGSYSIENVEIGQYRVYSAYSDAYFTEYLTETIEIMEDNQSVGGIDLYLESVETERGSISGNIIAESLFLDNTAYFMTLKYLATPDFEISMGFQEIDENQTYMYENLNTGNYKIGILFYGQFNGEIWYDTVYSEDDAQMIMIEPNNPQIQDIDFEISFDSLNQPYLHVENIVVDSGWDEILSNGEVFNVSYQIKNVGNLPSDSSSFYAYSPFSEVSMDIVIEELSLAAGEEIVLGPYPVTIDYNIEDEFNFHLFSSINSNFTHISNITNLTAYAPVIELSSYEISSNEGALIYGDNTVTVEILNSGGAHVNYPVVNVISADESVLIGEYNQTNYYWLEARTGSLEFIFDFEFLDNDFSNDELEFEINFSSLHTNMLQVLSFNLPTQQVTSNTEDVLLVNNLSMSNYPNPFNPETIISFNLPEDSRVSLDIFNIRGQLVKRIVNADFTKGNHQLIWKGTDEQNLEVSSGIYMYKLKTNKSQLVKKMLLSK